MGNGGRRLLDLSSGRSSIALSAGAPGDPRWKEYFLYSADFVGTSALAAASGANIDPTAAVFSSFPIKVHSDSDFEWLKTVYDFTAPGATGDPRVYLRLQDDSSGRRLHRSTLDARLAAGFGINLAALAGLANIESTAFLPFIEPEPYTFGAASTFTVDAADFSGVANTVRFTFHGNKVRPGYAPWERDAQGRPRRFRARLPFKLVLPPDGQTMAIAASQSVNVAAAVDLEADFLVLRLTLLHTSTGLIQIQDGPGRDRLWQDRAVSFNNIGGNGVFPNILPSPRFVYRGSSIQAQMQDTSAATNRVKLIFHGVKLYDA